MEKELIKKIQTMSGQKVILAISGGVDSVVLLDIFANSYPKNKIVIAHVNHNLRKESPIEQDFVEIIAKKYDIPFETTVLDLQSPAEATAREARYAFLESIRQKHQAAAVVTAHHTDDQIETYLLKLTRGSGPINSWGMKEHQGTIWRPLLGVEKEQLKEYAEAHSLKFVEDISNSDIRFSRNRLRHNVIPELEKINPNFKQSILNNINLGQEAAGCLRAEIKKALKKTVQGNTADIQKLKRLDPFLQKNIILEMLKKMDPKTEIYSKNVNEILKLLTKSGSKKTNIGAFTIAKNYDKIVFDFKAETPPTQISLKAGTQKFGNAQIKVSSNDSKKPFNKFMFPISVADLREATVRIRRAGDSIKTPGGTKKIQDIMVNHKIPLEKRNSWPLLTVKNRVAWVPGLESTEYNINNELRIEVKFEKN